MFGAALLSSVGWVISWTLRRKPATRHLVLHGALISCLALPALASLSVASGVTLISISISPANQVATDSQPADTESKPAPSQRKATLMPGPRSEERSPTVSEGGNSQGPDFDRLSANSAPLPPATSRAIDESVESALSVVASKTAPSPASQESPVHHTLSSARTPASFRGIATLAFSVWGGGCVLLLACLAWSFGRVVQLRRSSHVLQSSRSGIS